MAKMTAKQKRFCDEYLIDLNATQAAIRAGYSKKTAYRTGADNLIKPQIKQYIDERMAEKENEGDQMLTPRQEKFCIEYAASGNAYKSAIAAGYSENYAKGNANKLLENVRVKTNSSKTTTNYYN